MRTLVSWGIWHRQWRFVNDYREASYFQIDKIKIPNQDESG
jgi:muconolactone delta-isomerase